MHLFLKVILLGVGTLTYALDSKFPPKKKRISSSCLSEAYQKLGLHRGSPVPAALLDDIRRDPPNALIGYLVERHVELFAQGVSFYRAFNPTFVFKDEVSIEKMLAAFPQGYTLPCTSCAAGQTPVIKLGAFLDAWRDFHVHLLGPAWQTHTHNSDSGSIKFVRVFYLELAFAYAKKELAENSEFKKLNVPLHEFTSSATNPLMSLLGQHTDIAFSFGNVENFYVEFRKFATLRMSTDVQSTAHHKTPPKRLTPEQLINDSFTAEDIDNARRGEPYIEITLKQLDQNKSEIYRRFKSIARVNFERERVWTGILQGAPRRRPEPTYIDNRIVALDTARRILKDRGGREPLEQKHMSRGGDLFLHPTDVQAHFGSIWDLNFLLAEEKLIDMEPPDPTLVLPENIIARIKFINECVKNIRTASPNHFPLASLARDYSMADGDQIQLAAIAPIKNLWPRDLDFLNDLNMVLREEERIYFGPGVYNRMEQEFFLQVLTKRSWMIDSFNGFQNTDNGAENYISEATLQTFDFTLENMNAAIHQRRLDNQMQARL